MSQHKPNLVWDLMDLEEEAEPAAKATPNPPEPAKLEPVAIPLYQVEMIATVGNQLLDLRGRNNFRVHIMLPHGPTYRDIGWPGILNEVPAARPGTCLNSRTFEVKPPTDLAPRKFRFVKRMDYGEQIFNEVDDD